jgi:hypothetical protein
MAFSDYIAYVDESGDHSLESIDPQYPIFVLTFCIFRKLDYAARVTPSVQRFRLDHFGHDSVVLHEHAIRRQIAPFVFLKSEAKRTPFMVGLNDLVEQTPMTIVAAVVRKDALVLRYVRPSNPYEIALLFCMERLYAYLRDERALDGTTHVVFERRGKKEDAALELEFRRIRDGANQWGQLDCLDLVFADKKSNLAGLQLADLTARPIGLKVLRPAQGNRAYEIIERKLRRGPNGLMEDWGYKVFP